MRRKKGTLLPIEESILAAGLQLAGEGTDEFHGYAVAEKMRERDAARLLVSHGTLYKALERMQEAGLLTSRWVKTPRGGHRRLYTITPAGTRALALALVSKPAAARLLHERRATT